MRILETTAEMVSTCVNLSAYMPILPPQKMAEDMGVKR